ncbi:tRNA lysidine(34) synthetase TilS [Halotalea alkalilenta]|uniref:tRNA(Ile)-lysidine synthase n=1 Tax=Halotalea alkalilenta TaxID=376489 RepID=A0A172YCJ0_9GAMM|nr:tRNA lysidine(34) synthetase TilS [Halotalea alkalilenta]ANF56947.1 hypothetical protein A5892_05275 [Halotalea alkalilenta]
MAGADGERLTLDAAMAGAGSAKLWLALSGGLDSVCLLHLAIEAHARRRLAGEPVPSLHVIHVNHQLQEDAQRFEHFCRELCAALEVPLEVRSVDCLDHRMGPEAAAREARYRCFCAVLDEGDRLWLAHHRNDQAETFLLRALRGAGVSGLGGMPAARRLGRGWLERPLLGIGRDRLERLAGDRGWCWVEDTTNLELRYARNRLRHTVVPALETGWPGAAARLAETAERLSESARLLELFAAEDLVRLGADPTRLDCASLLALGEARAALLIRHALGRIDVPAPPRARLLELLAQLGAAEDRLVEVRWPGGVARRWRRALYLGSDALELDWPAWVAARLAQWQPVPKDGQRVALEGGKRCAGERLRLGGMSRRLKTLFQESGVPPWERDNLVLVRQSGSASLVAVLGERQAWVADGWRLARHGGAIVRGEY